MQELLQQVRILDPVSQTDRVGDVLIKEGVVTQIADAIADVSSDATILDCRGLVLAPGLVDLYSYSGEPGFEERETLRSLRLAAVAGGFTRIAVLPSTRPPIDNPASVHWFFDQQKAGDTGLEAGVEAGEGDREWMSGRVSESPSTIRLSAHAEAHPPMHSHTPPSLSSSPAPVPQPLLSLRDLTKHYVLESNPIARLFSGSDETIRAVDNITLDLYPGETLGLVGESGCGKSTLSRTILQLIRPTSGLVQFQGQNLTQLSRQQMQQQRRQLQMVFQDPRACLNPMMTVGNSIADPLLIHRLASAEDAKEQVLQMLERVKLIPAEEYYQRFPSELSGGQQQRVAIARALITRPQLVICDEPVSMLDATVQAQVLKLMQELKAEFNLTYLFITHDLWVAKSFCDRIAVMKSGQIVELGTTQAVFTQPQHPYTQTLLQAAPLLTMSSIEKEN